jgi:polar amino acid transport system substrate-binding protein
MGLGVSKDTVAEMKEKHLVFTRPYMSEGFVLVEKKEDLGKTKLADFKGAKIGVSMSTPADAYLIDNGYNRSIFFRDRMIFKALDSGEIDVGLVWSPAVAYIRKDFSKAKFQVVSDYEPEAGLRWNVAIAVPESEAEVKRLLDRAIDELLRNGEIKRIVESYGVPFYPPTT